MMSLRSRRGSGGDARRSAWHPAGGALSGSVPSPTRPHPPLSSPSPDPFFARPHRRHGRARPTAGVSAMHCPRERNLIPVWESWLILRVSCPRGVAVRRRTFGGAGCGVPCWRPRKLSTGGLRPGPWGTTTLPPEGLRRETAEDAWPETDSNRRGGRSLSAQTPDYPDWRDASARQPPRFLRGDETKDGLILQPVKRARQEERMSLPRRIA